MDLETAELVRIVYPHTIENALPLSRSMALTASGPSLVVHRRRYAKERSHAVTFLSQYQHTTRPAAAPLREKLSNLMFYRQENKLSPTFFNTPDIRGNRLPRPNLALSRQRALLARLCRQCVISDVKRVY